MKPSHLLLFSTFFFLNFTFLIAQVGIGTVSPDASSALDIVSTDSGVLVPRVSMVDVTNSSAPINSPVNGLLVFNTNVSVTGGNGVGFYFWDATSTRYLKLATGANNDWTLSGNALTDPTMNFIGTTDPQDLVVKTDDIERMRIDATGNVGIGTNNPANTLQVQGSVLFEGDFINQDAVGASAGTVQNVTFTNGTFNPLTGTNISITIVDGFGVNNSAVLVTGFARTFGGNLGSFGNSALGGYFLILERDTNPAFPTPIIVTYTSGTCYIKTPNGAGSAAIGYGGGGHISYLESGLAPGTYYYRLVFYPNGVGINSGTYDIYQRSLSAIEIKR